MISNKLYTRTVMHSLLNTEGRAQMIDHIGKNRSDITTGMRVKVVQKQDQRTGTLTEGVVRDILTKSSHHPHGIKVRLEGGIVGRVKEVIGPECRSIGV